MNTAVIICAAGKGSRFDEKKKKQFANVAGRPAFLRSLEFFSNRKDVKQLIVAISAEDEEMAKINYDSKLAFYGAKFCIGGQERFETVAKAIDTIDDGIDFIAVHDAVRCCLTDKWLDEVFEAAKKYDAAILAAPVVATIKKATGETIETTIDRTNLYEAQTPQVFNATLLKKAYANLENLDKAKISDDAQLIEALGKKVAIVKTDSSNIKITTKADVSIAEAIIKSRTTDETKGYVGPYGNVKW